MKEILLIRPIRMFIGKIRFYYYTKCVGNIKTLESEHALGPTVQHNLKAIGKFGFWRMNMLIKPLSVLENVPKDARILVIGPRNEDDVLNLIGNGFNAKHIIGLDLISYSPFIEIGDMHKTRFEDSFFDVIICGWTLSYSNEPKKFAMEAMRIIKENGVIAIGVEYSTMTNEQSIQIHGSYHLNSPNLKRINSTQQILELFDGYVKDVFFNHDAPNKISHQDKLLENVSNVTTIFSVTKGDYRS